MTAGKEYLIIPRKQLIRFSFRVTGFTSVVLHGSSMTVPDEPPKLLSVKNTTVKTIAQHIVEIVETSMSAYTNVTNDAQPTIISNIRLALMTKCIPRFDNVLIFTPSLYCFKNSSPSIRAKPRQKLK